jgi:RimJ/RimL family protein N-acetyltransferase
MVLCSYRLCLGINSSLLLDTMEKLRLLPKTRANVPVFWGAVKDHEIQEMFPFERETLEDALNNFEEYSTDESTGYGRSIWVEENYVGDVWAYCIDTKEKTGLISIVIFNKEFWTKGIGSKALRTFIPAVFKRYPINNLQAYTFSKNVASIKCLGKIGFEIADEFEEDGIWSKRLVIKK